LSSSWLATALTATLRGCDEGVISVWCAVQERTYKVADLLLEQRIFRQLFARWAWARAIRTRLLPYYHLLFPRRAAAIDSSNWEAAFCLVASPSELLNESPANAQTGSTAYLKSTSAGSGALVSDVMSIAAATVVGHSRLVLRGHHAALDLDAGPDHPSPQLEAYFLQEELIGLARYEPASKRLRIKSGAPRLHLHGRWASLLHSAPENWMHFLSESFPRLD
jgi:hypothetical protein